MPEGRETVPDGRELVPDGRVPTVVVPDGRVPTTLPGRVVLVPEGRVLTPDGCPETPEGRAPLTDGRLLTDGRVELLFGRDPYGEFGRLSQ